MTLSTPTSIDSTLIVVAVKVAVPAEVYIAAVALTCVVVCVVILVADRVIAQRPGDGARFRARLGGRP